MFALMWLLQLYILCVEVEAIVSELNRKLYVMATKDWVGTNVQ